MVAGCGNKCVKYFFFLINFLFFALGGVVCGLALWVRFDNDFQGKVINVLQGGNGNSGGTSTPIQLDTLYIILYVIAALGLLLFILGFFGCCGSCCENVCAIGLYFVLVLALFVILLAGGIYVLVKRDDIRQQFVNVWRTEFVDKYSTVPEAVRTNINNIQTQLQCCGATGCQDFAAPPLSCNCTTFGNALNTRKGCASFIYSFIDSNMTIIIIIAAAILVVELIAMVLSCVLIHAVKEKSSMNF